MGLVVKEDITPNPIYVRLFCSIGIMLEAYSIANLVEKLLFCAIGQLPMLIYAILFSVFLPIFNLRQPKRTRPLATHKF